MIISTSIFEQKRGRQRNQADGDESKTFHIQIMICKNIKVHIYCDAFTWGSLAWCRMKTCCAKTSKDVACALHQGITWMVTVTVWFVYFPFTRLDVTLTRSRILRDIRLDLPLPLITTWPSFIVLTRSHRNKTSRLLFSVAFLRNW